MDDWSRLLAVARRMANLTQEDFASDLGVGRATLAHWENGRRPVPAKVKRWILDFMGGYYRDRADFKNMLAVAEASDGFVTLYRPGLIIQGATSYARRTWKQAMNTEMVGQQVLPLMRRDMKFLEFYEKYYRTMLSGQSEVVSVSYVDESLLFPGRLVKASVTAVDVGEGRILRMENAYLPDLPGRAPPDQGVNIITMDDVGYN
ncbi:helix-turn-helix transcriptional regulator [Niveispirillum sp.]|uniref:helix-turn-helix domain-containing protein n=1 Tax=Niveispirillum sp. TaxID=1917217 RepID=UPI001B67F3C4|nr:helix-turn-helix transcriptional regulator [Niveispirillum sp.]MBP7337272.1 helix-turn-helix transcriptional regulator [Niveispirillum sp.]